MNEFRFNHSSRETDHFSKMLSICARTIFSTYAGVHAYINIFIRIRYNCTKIFEYIYIQKKEKEKIKNIKS